MTLEREPFVLTDVCYQLDFIATVEWDWDIHRSRIDKYYLDCGRTEWFIWCMMPIDEGIILDVTQEGFPEPEYVLYSYGPKEGVSQKQAAVYLLMDAWCAERENGLDKFHIVSDVDYLASEELNAISAMVW